MFCWVIRAKPRFCCKLAIKELKLFFAFAESLPTSATLNSANSVNSVQAVYSAMLPPSLVVFLFLKTTNVFWCFGAGRCEDQLGISVNLLYRGRFFWFSCFFCWRFSFGRTFSRLRCILSWPSFGDGVENPRGEGGQVGEDSCNNLFIAHQLLAISRLKILNIPFSLHLKNV